MKLFLLLFSFVFVACGTADNTSVFTSESADGASSVSFSSGSSNTSSSSSTSTSSSTSADRVETTSQSSATTTTSSNTSSSSNVSSKVIRRFLWKPVSERDGNVVVLVDPTDVQIIVSGSRSESLTDFGPSNGRGTTSRGSFPGCGYGTSVLVEFFDRFGRRVRMASGHNSVRVKDGCDRMEVEL